MNKTIKISIVAVAAVAIVSGVFYSLYLPQSPAVADPYCQTKEEAMAVPQGKLAMKEPTYLPEGYQFLCAEGTSHYVILYYGSSEVLSNVDLPTRNELIDNGAIFIAAVRADPEADDAYYLIDRKSAIEKYFNDQGTAIETRITEINGNLAAVREMCEDCGQGFITYEDGQTEQTSSFPVPAVIVFYDEDVRYRLEAFMPSTELEKVARSLEYRE